MAIIVPLLLVVSIVLVIVVALLIFIVLRNKDQNYSPSQSSGVALYNDRKNIFVSKPVASLWESIQTQSAYAINGSSSYEDIREFLVAFGFLVGTGSNGAAFVKDKVTLYSGLESHPGCGNVWTMNTLLRQFPGSGSNYSAQGYECDVDNNNEHRGDLPGAGGLALPITVGVQIVGAGNFRSTAALLINGPAVRPIWNRGIVLANNCVTQSSFQDFNSGNDKSIDIQGSPKFAVYVASPSSQSYFAGNVAIGPSTSDIPRSTLDVNGNIFYTGTLAKVAPRGTQVGASSVSYTVQCQNQTIMKNMDIRLDSFGKAVIKGLRASNVQLTPRDQAMPNLFYKTDKEKTIEIFGGAPFGRICVTLFIEEME